MKKRVKGFLMASVVFTGSLFNVSYGSDFNIELNQKPYTLIRKPIIEEASIFLPMREVSEQMGYKVIWNEERQTVDVIRNNENLKLYLGLEDVILNGSKSKLIHKPRLIESRVYSSIDTFSEYLDNIVAIDYGYENIAIDQKRELDENFFMESTDQILKEKISKFMDEYTKNQNFQGSVLVAKDNKILLNEGYGYSNKELGVKNTSQTKFAIGSITKQFVGTGIVQLEEKGLLSFEDKLSKYVDDFKYGDDITIHNLLSHTSGLVNVTNLPEFYDLNPSSPLSAVNLARDMELISKPGEKFEYCNTNYILLGMILEKVSGTNLENYFNDNFFEPVGMKDTGLAYGEKSGFSIATPYQGYIDTYSVDDRGLLENAYGAGSVYSTVEDMYRWNKALDGNKILSDTGKAKLFKGYESMGNNVYYSYGWMVGEKNGEKFYQHDGSTLGFSALSSKNIDKNIDIIVLSNRRLTNVYEISGALENILSGINIESKDIPKLPKEVKLDLSEYKKYEGKYILNNPLSNEDMVMDILMENEKLFLKVDEQEKIEIFPQGDNKFFTKILESSMVFNFNEDEIATEILFKQMGMDFKGYREGFEREEIIIEEEILSKYVGLYNLAEGFDLDIKLENGKLNLTPTGQGTIPLIAINKNKFELSLIDATIEFIIEEDGSVNKLDYIQGEYKGKANRK